MSNCYSTRSIEFDEKSSCTMSRRNLTSRVQRLFNLDQCIHDKATIWKQKKIYIHHKATKRGAAAGPKNCGEITELQWQYKRKEAREKFKSPLC